jgi:general secretion pathway protein E
MGIEPYQVTSSVSAVLNQRLVRRLCTACRRKNSDPRLRREASGTFEPAGCAECFGTGFKGRILIAEMIRLDSRLRKAILTKPDGDELAKILDDAGHKNMFEQGKVLVSEGLTTQQELQNVCAAAADELKQ